MSPDSNIMLYTEGTPNGLKISIALEELGLNYNVRAIKLFEHEQKEQWFLDINPNGRIPALVDTDKHGQALKIWESGAILQYLVARYDADHKISYAYDTKEHWEVTSWLMWQMGGVGPMQGQANHFALSAGADYPYALNRYVNETRRLYRTMDTALAANPSGYLVGDRVTIADIAVWPWVTAYKYSGLSTIDEFPHVKAWMYKLLARPGFEKGRNVPTPHIYLKLVDMPEEELKKIGRERSGWIHEAMKRDAKA
ncbi:glutathione S-transferase [Massariosphaeria phaeospora]|uniref:Glutathione S-transferase n=1 Tax=Massariosphaeria phaeospora TaxID=100035 RepID=A0A7C8IR41_9PLEO|nr:glutathione S-transferase [Massariosphaeria phaeospora]